MNVIYIMTNHSIWYRYTNIEHLSSTVRLSFNASACTLKTNYQTAIHLLLTRIRIKERIHVLLVIIEVLDLHVHVLLL